MKIVTPQQLRRKAVRLLLKEVNKELSKDPLSRDRTTVGLGMSADLKVVKKVQRKVEKAGWDVEIQFHGVNSNRPVGLLIKRKTKKVQEES